MYPASQALPSPPAPADRVRRFRGWGLGFGVRSLGFRVYDLEFGVLSLGFGVSVWDLGCRGLDFGVWGLRFLGCYI